MKSIFLLLGLFPFCLVAQPDSNKQAVDVNFLLHYYDQDGIHSAVTGGQGTEKLEDRATDIQIVIPLDSSQKLRINTHLNHYSSASTDNIDSYVSSASKVDSRFWLQMGYARQTSGFGWSLNGSVSIESDYISRSLGGGLAWMSPKQDKSLDLGFQLFLDNWIVIFPEELRAPGLASVPTDRRRSFDLSLSYSHTINKRLQTALSLEGVVQQGLLSTPFHRVYFQQQVLPKIEKLPQWRFKTPMGLRVHYFATDWLVLRSYYRFYWDNFGLLAHTLQLESPIKAGLALTFLPFYRYHIQQGSVYFAPYAAHMEEALYYTSDFDLSTFTSQKLGLGVRLSPLYGLGRFQVGSEGIGMLKSLQIRYAWYGRSDGLRAHIFSLDSQWKFN